MRPLGLALWGGLGLCGCGGTALEGSLTTTMDLSYTRAEVAVLPDQTTVNFLHPRGDGGGDDIVFQVTAKLEGISLEAGKAIDLTELLASGTQRGVLARNVLGDPRQSFPELQRGQLQFDAVPEKGKGVGGNFSATFVQCIEAACGRTVFGDFEGSVP